MSLKISYVAADQRSTALRLLFARFPLEEQQARLSDALRSAEQGRLNLDGLLLAEEGGNPVGVALTMHQLDRVSLVWPPVLTCQVSEMAIVQDALMSGLCDEIDRAGSKLAQALLNPDDVDEMHVLQRHSFEHLADMFFLARMLSEKDFEPTSACHEFDFENFSDAATDRFAAAIERTYQQSLDCPFLDGFRNGADALVSHQLSGCFDPAGWRLYRNNGQDVGVLLMNEHPDQDAIELVYFGIVPEFRGRGFGRKILADGIQAAALTGRAAMFLAVDCGNTYANALYGELGFAELARRRVMVRRSSRLAHE
jgi:ribosomal protein S18 acetylase RimI-like enzyme